jgi:hypothetical protein
LFGPMERYIFPCWLSPTNSDLGSTQILTRYHSARSQNVGTTPMRQVPGQFNPSVLLKSLRMGSMRMPNTF